jgi:MFS family permease
MSKKQVLALFVCAVVPYTIGNGITPLLSVYATELGASRAVAGYCLSFCQLALAAGTFGAGWLSDRPQHRGMLIMMGGMISIPAVSLIGRAPSVWHLIAFLGTFFFCAGMTATLISILAGLLAGKGERGRTFGILSLAPSLGALIGGATAGPIVDKWGYPTMYAALSVFGILWPATALLLKDGEATRVQRGDTSAQGKRVGLGRGFYLLFVASLAAMAASFVSRLGTWLAMNDLGFAAAAVSSTSAIGGVVTLPLPPLIGWLSDRLGRKQFLGLCYLTGTVSLLILLVAASLAHFWVVISLLYALCSVNGAVGPALVTDIVPRESLGRGISLFSATPWIGGVIGFAVTGSAVQHLGMPTTFILAALLPLTAIVLLIPVPQTRHEEGSAPHSENRAA